MQNRAKNVQDGHLHKHRQKIVFRTPFWSKKPTFSRFLKSLWVAGGLPGRPGSLPEFVIFFMNLQLHLKTSPEGSPGAPGRLWRPPWAHIGPLGPHIGPLGPTWEALGCPQAPLAPFGPFNGGPLFGPIPLRCDPNSPVAGKPLVEFISEGSAALVQAELTLTSQQVLLLVVRWLFGRKAPQQHPAKGTIGWQ